MLRATLTDGRQHTQNSQGWDETKLERGQACYHQPTINDLKYDFLDMPEIGTDLRVAVMLRFHRFRLRDFIRLF